MPPTKKLRTAWLWSALSAGVGFFTIIAIVSLFGPETFAAYVVATASLAIVGLLMETLPSAYFMIKVQETRSYLRDLIWANAVIAIIMAIVGFAAFTCRFITPYSLWMYLYLLTLPFYNLSTLHLLAIGDTAELYRRNCMAACIRAGVICLGGALQVCPSHDVLWSGLALSQIYATLVWGLREAKRDQLFRTDGPIKCLSRLYANRIAYRGYYLNSILKRGRDSSVTLAPAAIVGDPIALAAYFLVYRGTEFVCGQLRIVEMLLINLENRAAFRVGRRKRLLLLGVVAFACSICASLLLGFQVYTQWTLLLAALVSGLFVFPYVAEITLRSDAYAAFQPRRVTLSLVVFTVCLVGGFALLSMLDVLWTPALAAIPVFAQSAASATYLISQRKRNAKQPP